LSLTNRKELIPEGVFTWLADVLAPAIRLYEKHGFVRVPLDAHERFVRANIRLERAP